MLISSISVQPALQQGSSANPYSYKSDSDLAQSFGDNFQAFKHPTTPNATTDKIREVAARPLTGDAKGDNETHLARELLKRDHIMPVSASTLQITYWLRPGLSGTR